MLDPARWPGTTIANWEPFVQLAASMMPEPGSDRTILFRGQAAEWELTPKLLRHLPAGVSASAAIRAEAAALDHFKSQAHLHYEAGFHLADSKPTLADWWALMQHHGAPTRLLDWTASPYVALYYAVEQEPGSDGVVLVIEGETPERNFKQQYPHQSLENSLALGEDAPAGLRVFTPFFKTPRLVAQQGYFTASVRVLDPQDTLLQENGAIIRRWIVPASLKPRFMRHLRVMNVSAQTLFPGLDGLGRAAAELIRAEGAL